MCVWDLNRQILPAHYRVLGLQSRGEGGSGNPDSPLRRVVQGPWRPGVEGLVSLDLDQKLNVRLLDFYLWCSLLSWKGRTISELARRPSPEKKQATAGLE